MRRAVDFRDGLIIALLAARPLRIGNFAKLRLGDHLKPIPHGYRIEIPAEEAKNGRPIETVVPDAVMPWLLMYLETYRPCLLAGKEDRHLWISRSRTTDQFQRHGNTGL